MEKIVITRHPALVELLKERGLIDGSEPVLTHASEKDVKNVDYCKDFKERKD